MEHEEKNYFDNMGLTVNSLFEQSTKNQFLIVDSRWRRLLRRYIAGFLIAIGCYSRLVDAGFIRGWFSEFQNYWMGIHNGRPLYFHDFHFLLGIYRQRFQAVETLPNASPREFLDSWQGSTSWYQLFGAVRRFAHEPLHCYHFETWIKNGDRILEYGCGIAPIAYSLSRYGRARGLEIDIADIRQINSHFARWRLGSLARFIELQPLEKVALRETYDVIFLVTVMEHLPDPLTTVTNLLDALKPKGIFIFDYVLSDGDGQDTVESVRDRESVLELIDGRTTLLKGSINYENSMDLTVVQHK